MSGIQPLMLGTATTFRSIVGWHFSSWTLKQRIIWKYLSTIWIKFNYISHKILFHLPTINLNYRNIHGLWAVESESHSVVSDSLWPYALYSQWNSPGQNTGVGSISLLQGIFPTHGLNPGFPHCRQIPYQLSHQGNPRILEWVAVKNIT